MLQEGQREFLDSIGGHILHLAQGETVSSDAFVDLEGYYTKWFEENDCEAVLVRPDFYIFGVANRVEEVPKLVADLQTQLMMVSTTGRK